jgi:hypothetical protein
MGVDMWYIRKYKVIITDKGTDLNPIGELESSDVVPEYNDQECDLQISINKSDQ